MTATERKSLFLGKIRLFALHIAHNAMQNIQIHLPQRSRTVILVGNHANADDFLYIQRMEMMSSPRRYDGQIPEDMV